MDQKDLWVTKEQLVDLLGISRSMVDKLREEQGLPDHIWGRSVRFYLPEIELWLDKRLTQK